MFNKTALFLSAILFSSLSFSESAAYILQDGSFARCSNMADIGSRAYRLTVLSSEQKQIKLKLDTLVCISSISIQGSVQLESKALSEKIIFNNQKDSMTYKMKSAVLQITNSEGTEELLKINIDINSSTQTLDFNLPLTDEAQIDLTIIGLEVIELNDQPYDQGLTFGGHYRLLLNN